MKEDKTIREITIPQVRQDNPDASFIADDLIVFDNLDNLTFPSEAVRLQCLFVALCTEGKAQYTVDTRQRQVGRGDVIIVSQGQVVADYLMSQQCRGVAVMMSGNFFRDIISDVHELSSLFLFSRMHPVFHLTDGQAATILGYTRLIKQKVDETEHHFRRELVTSLMQSLVYDMSNVIYISQQSGTVKRTRAEEIFTDFIRLVEANFRSQRRVSWYADALCITPKYLSETVKNVSRRSPIEWIDNYVTLEMRVMLRNSTISIKEMTQQLHFPNQSFLGKYFKERVGVSPSEYRKQGSKS